MQEQTSIPQEIPDFKSAKELGAYLKQLRKPRFRTLLAMAARLPEKGRDTFYAYTRRFEFGRLPQQGSVLNNSFSVYLGFLGFSPEKREQIIKTSHSFSGELPSKKYNHPLEDFPEKFKKNMAEILRKNQDIVKTMEKIYNHPFCLDELTYVAEEITRKYHSYAEQVSKVLDRVKRLGFDKGLIGSSAIGIISLEDCIGKEPPDPVGNLGPSVRTLILRLNEAAKTDANAKQIKQKFESSRDNYYSQRAVLINTIKGYVSS